jgi:hypothetical protein
VAGHGPSHSHPSQLASLIIARRASSHPSAPTLSGRLLLGRVRSWEDFLEADSSISPPSPTAAKGGFPGRCRGLDRRNRAILSTELRRHDGGEARRGLRSRERGARRRTSADGVRGEVRWLSPNRARGVPRHATVCISPWGLQFKFPEDFLSKDTARPVASVLRDDRTTQDQLRTGPRARIGEQTVGLNARSRTHEPCERRRSERRATR